MTKKEIYQRQFYAKYSCKSIIRNGGWKFIGMSALTAVIVLFYSDFNISFSSINRNNILLFLSITGPLTTGILFATKEIKVENNTLYHRTVFPGKWNKIMLSDVHHICYFQKPVERFSIFPKVVFFQNENDRLTLIELLISRTDIYKLLSLIHDKGIPVLFFNELKNIEETEYYIGPDKYSS